MICFRCRSDAVRVQEALGLRLGRFGLALEPDETKLVEFGRSAQRHPGKHGRNRPETIHVLGMRLYRAWNRRGGSEVGMRPEKSRSRRSPTTLRDLMRRIRHDTIPRQVDESDVVLRGRCASHGSAGNSQSLFKMYRAVERFPRKILCRRSRAGAHLGWDAFDQIKARTPLLRPKLVQPHRALQSLAAR